MEAMNMKKDADSKRFTKAVWCVAAIALGLTALAGAHEVVKPQPHQEWVTINLPNPPAPLPDSAAPVSVPSDSK
jgi:hypothetical protein